MDVPASTDFLDRRIIDQCFVSSVACGAQQSLAGRIVTRFDGF
jgi:hypothetical protein